jgi:proline dehydrogenase
MRHTLRSVLRRAWTPLLRQASRSYVVGPDLSDALRACSSLHAQGVSSTVCFWDSGDDSPDDVARAYSAAIQACAQERLDSYVSVKAPALRFSPDSCAALAEQVRRHAIGIHFDSLGPEVADRTFELLGELAPGRGSIGCTLPGAWRRSPADAGRAVELDLRVRVVKGQWPDPEAPVTDLRKGFLDVVGQLAGQARHVAVASHDPVVVRAALERLRSAGTPCELELLFGLPARHVLPVAQDLGVRVRMYVPYGHAWLPYALRQVRKNPRIAFWVIRDSCTPASSRLRLLPRV